MYLKKQLKEAAANKSFQEWFQSADSHQGSREEENRKQGKVENNWLQSPYMVW